MIAAPMMTSGVDVSLPKGAGDPTTEKSQPISISIKNDGKIFIGEELIKLSALSNKIIEISHKDFNTKIHIKADQSLDYGRVMNIVKTVNLSGFSQVVLVTEIES
jgi:biopolymer transport protein TolR